MHNLLRRPAFESLLALLLTAAGLAVANMGFSSEAFAAESRGDSSSKEKGGPAPTSPPENLSNGDGREVVIRDLPDEVQETKRRYEVSMTWETHRLLQQADLEGAGANKLVNYLSLGARYDLSNYDRVSIRGGVYQRFLVDEGETGFRLSDTSVAYTRLVPLPGKVQFSATPSVTFGTSFDSQLQSLIAAPRLSFGVERSFGRLDANVRAGATAFLNRYNSAAGGAPNPMWSANVSAGAEFRFPVIEVLYLGASLYTGTTKFYRGTGTPLGEYHIPSQDPLFSSSPLTQTYGAEFYLRYAMPVLWEMKSDVTVAYANGDSTLGYASVLHDGVPHVYGFWRTNGQLFGALAVRY